MSQDLIQRLRTCSKKKRRAVAMELAQTRTDEAVNEFIRMVEGSHRTRLRRYNVDAALIGVDALVETRDPYALQYVERLSHRKTSTGEGHDHRLTDSPVMGGTSTNIEYPNAPGRLGKILKYNVCDFCVGTGSGHPDTGRAVKTISNAATKAREYMGLNTQPTQ